MTGVPWRIQRLNHDATWVLEVGEDRVVFDPWLVGSEVDVAPWFNEAWHVDPVATLSSVPEATAIVISQHYADHCHAQTLRAWPGTPAVWAVPQAVSQVRRARPDLVVTPITPEDRPMGALRIRRLTRPWWHPPRYHTIVVTAADGRRAVHAPHGLPEPASRSLAPVHLLATSRAGFQLPWFLGGRVNPGPDAAERTARACEAAHALAIHDEAKRSAGLVAKLARTDRRAPTQPCTPSPWRDDVGMVPVSL